MASKRTRLVERGVNPDRLTDKQRVFVQEYLADSEFNAVNAARKAGYSQPNTSAYKLLGNKLVAAAIGKALKERSDRLQMTADDVLRQLMFAVMRDPLDLCDADGVFRVRDLRDVPKHMRQCIDGIKAKQRTTPDGEEVTEIELKLIPKGPMIELAMRHFGLLNDKLNIKTDDISLADLLHELEDNEVMRPRVVDGSVIDALAEES